jgi:hypothetical protein
MVLTFDEATHIYKINDVQAPSVTQTVDLLTAGKYSSGDVLMAQARRRGARVHEICELIDYGAIPDEIEPELVGYVKAYLAFLRDYNPTWTHVEHIMFHSLLGYAGTEDRRGLIAGKVTNVDIKTTESMDRVSKIALACQLAGYEFMAIDNGLAPASNSWGVQLKKDGTYTVHEQRKIENKYHFDSKMLFLDLLTITKLLGGYQ